MPPSPVKFQSFDVGEDDTLPLLTHASDSDTDDDDEVEAELTVTEHDAAGAVAKVHVLVNKYRFRLMGDSPEFMPLDRHLFNDVKLATKRNVSLTRGLPDTDKRG